MMMHIQTASTYMQAEPAIKQQKQYTVYLNYSKYVITQYFSNV